jgi:hypothetical protein
MATIILCTDFSATSRNAASYVCSLAKDRSQSEDLRFLLLHLYDLPTSYSGESLALTTIPHEMQYAEQSLEEQWEWLRKQYPQLLIERKLAIGNLHHGLLTQIEEVDPSLIVIGAGGHYRELLSWDKEILQVIRELPVPVLVIPKHVSFAPLKQVAFSCNLKTVNERMPFDMIRGLIRFTGAELHVVIVTPSEETKGTLEKNQLVQQELKEVNPQYHILHEKEVVEAIGHFVKEQHIDLLLVTPRRHGIWEGLFNKDYAKKLVRLEALPILALRERSNIWS